MTAGREEGRGARDAPRPATSSVSTRSSEIAAAERPFAFSAGDGASM